MPLVQIAQIKGMLMLKPLPVGLYTFRDIIEGGFLYVDKTRWIYELVRYRKGIYFLSRPRRFGKSLLVSTLSEIFHGNRDLFQGLWLYASDYDWKEHPVIHLDFSQYTADNAEQLKSIIKGYLQDVAFDHGITLREDGYQQQFGSLIRQLAARERVVILIDEYDKPILDHLDNLEEAQRVRDVLKAFYTVIKSLDRYIRFVFLTGISKFSKVGVFSGLNNLNDLTMIPRFAAAVGLTEEEIRTHFADYIASFAEKEATTAEELLVQMRQWYNGFCFAPNGENVYNPFSTLLFFEHQRFASFWFETGTPTFLINLIREKNYDIEIIEDLIVPETVFSVYEVENLNITPLLFQTGYLTIKDYDKETLLYTLYYPNYEVENAFLNYLLNSYKSTQRELVEKHLWDLVRALQANALDAFFTTLAIFFAQVPYNIQIKQEKYYQTIFYLIFKLIGLKIDAELHTNQGRIDAVIELADRIYLFEFKLDGSAAEALQQIKDNQYVQRYRSTGKPLHLIGANFDTATRTITEWKLEDDSATDT